jgi:hypothetical protein
MLQYDLQPAMGLTYRELPPEEFHRLQGHEALKGVGVPSPDTARILIAERASGEIVGFQMLVTVVHLEPIWVHPDYRGSMLPVRLWKAATRLLDALRIPMAFSFSDNPTISGYLSRLGLRKLQYETFLFDPQERYPQ